MAYATDAEAIVYFAGTVNEAKWTAIDPAQRDLLLQSASNYLDIAFKFTGTQTDEVLSFPRDECYNKCTMSTYDNDVVPGIVKNATCEIALEMDSNPDLSPSTIGSTDYNIKSEKVDVIKVEYKDNSSQAKAPDAYGTVWLSCILNANNTGMASARTIKG